MYRLENMKIQGNNSINFGWSCETHRQIMSAAIKDLPQFEKYRNTLEDYVQRPDHDDIGFLANKHFYFGEKIPEKNFSNDEFVKESVNLNKLGFLNTPVANSATNIFKKIFNTDGVSFMDYNGRNNAKAAYEDQIEIMDTAIEDEDEEFAIQNAARACHFLQDITQPQHIEETSTIGKAVDLKIHTDYEKFAEDNLDTFTKNCQTSNTEPRNSMKLFADNFTATKELGKITRENEPNWNEITQKQFDMAVQSTKEFLQNVSIQMGLSKNIENTDNNTTDNK